MTPSEILRKYDIGELNKNEAIDEIEKMMVDKYWKGYNMALRHAIIKIEEQKR